MSLLVRVTIQRGETAELVWVYPSAEDPADLTEWSASTRFCDLRGNTLAELTTGNDGMTLGADGTVRVNLDEADTAEWSFWHGRILVDLIDPDGHPLSYVEGTFVCGDDVTVVEELAGEPPATGHTHNADYYTKSQVDDLVDGVTGGSSAALDAEVAARVAGDTALGTQLATEASVRAGADASLLTTIGNETTARTAADTALDARVDALEAAPDVPDLTDALADEVTARQAGDTALDTRVDALEAAAPGYVTDAELTGVASTLTAADAALDTRVDALEAATGPDLSGYATDAELAAEATARANADTALDGRVDNLEAAPPAHDHPTSDVTGLAEFIMDTVYANLAEGSNVTLSYDDDGTGKITITATGGGGGGGLDAEAVRDLLGTVLVEGSGISIDVDDPGDTVTISASGGGMDADALYNLMANGRFINVSVIDGFVQVDNTAPLFAPFWNAFIDYTTNDTVIVSGVLYKSLTSGNMGNAPASSPTHWAEIVLDAPAASVASTDITDSTTVGRAVLTAADAAAARSAIGAGTSSLAIGTTGTTAKAGNYQPTAANISDSTTVGRAVLTAADAAAAPTAISAAAASHTHEGTTVDATGVTDGYVLTADGAGNAGWEAVPGGGGGGTVASTDITDSTATGRAVLTATDAAAARTAIAAAPDTAVQPTIVDAKGDLLAGTAADTLARLAVGSAGDSLIPDSTASTGLAWGVPLLKINTNSGTTIAPALADHGKTHRMTAASAITVTLPSDATLALPIGWYAVYKRCNTGTLTFAAGGGATIEDYAGTLSARVEGSSIMVTKVAANTFTLDGDLG